MNLSNSVKIGNLDNILDTTGDKVFDFCFADPPYFMQLEKNKKLIRVGGNEYDGCDDEWDQFNSMDDYKNFTKNWISKIHRTLKNDGILVVISSMQSIYEIGNILREQGWWIINEIIWLKSNPTPNFRGTRLTNSHETMIVAVKSKKSKYTFNYKTAKYFNNEKQLGSVWTLPVCSGNERLKDENGIKVHTTQKPKELLYRLITIFTKPNDLVLDIFAGTLTTSIACKRTNRRYFAIEQNARYVKYGLKRLNQTKQEINEITLATRDIKPVKVSFKSLIENQLLHLNERIYTKFGDYVVLENDKGNVIINDQIESIHVVAAKLLNREGRINAFDYLYVKRDNKYILLDELRHIYRQNLMS